MKRDGSVHETARKHGEIGRQALCDLSQLEAGKLAIEPEQEDLHLTAGHIA